ncbi:CPBP family intramembrane glutamic endopeptidase [Ulvibacterium sp.]|uniref:CPBP family intramembrane glutamic endopeptidase n=1 Tax=Ulvibacterium sp. TaxID=2665914 RepID=UPI003BA8A5E1
MLHELLVFLKNPVYRTDENRDFNYRFGIFLRLLGVSLVLSFVLGWAIGAIQVIFDLDFGKHAVDDFIERYSFLWVLLGAVVVAPIVEELIFRAPLSLFRKNKRFPLFFYAFTLIFGFYHITNFEMHSTTLLLSPVLVAPQLVAGTILGYIRVRFGLLWAIMLHACYNLILMGPVILVKTFNVPIS